jgi:hypothetical protein
MCNLADNGEAMENNHQQPWTWSEPDAGETMGGGPAVPRVPGDGWVKVTWYSGKVSVLKIREVTYLGDHGVMILYPPSPSGNPVIHHRIPRRTSELLSEAQALALLEQHGLPMPGEAAETPQEAEGYDG